MQSWGLTDPGCVRKQNQDAYRIEQLDHNTLLCVVCDGMGGAKSGNVASTLAVEVFVEEMQYSDEPITAFISENIADIYQELRDLCSNFQLEDEDVQNDALYAYVEAFEQHWGQKLLNVLRPLHVLLLMKDSSSYE
jgi:serine/threonine protein phosphatase PrpC